MSMYLGNELVTGTKIRKDTVIIRNDGGYFLSEVTGELPSAQPEIIRCKDCEHYDDGLCRRWKYSHVTSEDSFCSGAERREE